MPRRLSVFLCYASQDKPAVRELYNALVSEGWIDPWLDKVKILPGQDWEVVIEKAVETSDVVIACLSNQSISKDGHIQKEIRYAYDIALEKPEEMIFLIPLRLDDCNVPRKLKTLHWVDYFGDEKDESFANLLESLKLRYDQKLKTELEHERDEQVKQEAEELSRKLSDKKAALERAEKDAKTELEARMKWRREQADRWKTESNKEKQVLQKVKSDTTPPKDKKVMSPPALSWDQLLAERKLDVVGIILVFFGIITFLGLISANRSVLVGGAIFFLSQIFGWGVYILPLGLLVFGLWLVLRKIERIPPFSLERVIGSVIIFVWFLTVLHSLLHSLVSTAEAAESLALAGMGGGALGALFQRLLLHWLGSGGAFIALIAWLIIGLSFFFNVLNSKLTLLQLLGLWIRRLLRSSKSNR